MWNWDKPELVYEKRGITAKSYKSTGGEIDRSFNIGVFFGSYESRCLESSKILKNNSIENSILFLFEEKKEHPLRIKNDESLKQQLIACSKENPNLLDNNKIQEVEENIRKILKHIPSECFNNGSNWFIDISGCPKPYYLGILAFLRNRMNSYKITLFHPSGYYEETTHRNEAFSFTSGSGKEMKIPWLWGNPNHLYKWTYVYLLGFEGNRSYEIYEKYEPDNVYALIASPGYRPDYEKIALEKNRQFLKESNAQIIKADASNIVEVWKIIEKEINEENKNTNICFVPLGTRPHALACCLASLTNVNSSVSYVMPRDFVAEERKRGEYLWIYDITM
jgi:hypothetical protein